MNTVLLRKVAERLVTGYELFGSKWGNCEAEVIAMQTIKACQRNLDHHGVAFSWLSTTATAGRGRDGTDNAHGLQLLLQDGSLVQDDYLGALQPPAGTQRINGMSQVLRVTDALLLYAAEMLSVSVTEGTPDASA
jgi:hypothetical protein